VTRIGYARVSTADQDPALQLDAMRAAGCDPVFVDRASGSRADRPELARALDYLRSGDTLVVWKLDRLGRNLGHLVDVLTGLHGRGVEFASITEGMDTSTSMGRLLFHIMGSLAEFERELIRERTMAGLAAAKAAGRTGGRPKALTPAREQAARNLRAAGTSVPDIARILRVGTSTIYRSLESVS
jgi:DNA invertase Pin-like site-specific DNA recombinase